MRMPVALLAVGVLFTGVMPAERTALDSSLGAGGNAAASWCEKCVPPGVCQATGNGEWGTTHCQGLGGMRCEVGGNECSWVIEAFGGAALTLVAASGATHRVIPIAPGVWTSAECGSEVVAIGSQPGAEALLAE